MPSTSVAKQLFLKVPDGECASLDARTIWVMPLCSFKKVEHWVLAWLDFGRQKVCFFDSIPENASTSWAEPVCISRGL